MGQGCGELADFRLGLAEVWPGLRKSESKLKDPKMEENTIASSRKQSCPPHRVGYVFMPHREKTTKTFLHLITKPLKSGNNIDVLLSLGSPQILIQVLLTALLRSL